MRYGGDGNGIYGGLSPYSNWTFASPTFTGVSTFANGSATAPSITFTGGATNGFFLPAAGTGVAVSSGGTDVATFRNTAGLKLSSTEPLSWASGVSSSTANDTHLYRDAANVIAQKNSTTAQELRIYGSEITAGTRYSRLTIKHATASVTADAGATVTATNLIPAKANVLGVNTVVTTGLGTGSGTTGYTVGDGTDADRWGSVTGTAAGTDTDGADATADPTGWFTAANNVVLTAAGGNFDGTGVIFVDVAYTITEAA